MRSAASYARGGALVIALTFGGFGVWAGMARIDSAVIAPGAITTVERGQRVQHLEGGIVTEVLVLEGDMVAAGDLLVRLDPVQQRADLTGIRDRIAAARARVARLAAERARAASVAFPDDLPPEVIRRETAVFEERRSVLAVNEGILEQSASQFRLEIEALSEQAEALGQRLALQADLLARMEDGDDRGVVEANRVLAQRDLMIQIRAAMGEVTADRAAARSNELSAEAELARLRQEFSARAATELGAAEEDLQRAQAELAVIEDALRRTDLRAPVRGRVQALDVAPNDVIRPGQVLMEITPDEQDFVVTARISPLDIENIGAGQAVEIRFRGFASQRMAPAFGTVLSVSDDIVTDTTGDTQGHYIARITVDRETLPPEIAATVTFGMPVEVFLLQGERRVITYLVTPITDALRRSMREAD